MSVDYEFLNRFLVLCHAAGIEHAVICSGSRSAPLSISFARYDRIKCHPVIDERSAGFIALGIAQATKKPVAIVVTSGTAVANLYPAICEAYFSHTPLLILSADRPPSQIDRYEGQSIFQENIFGKHVLKSFSAPLFISEQTFPFFENKTKEILETLHQIRKGPVHINFPFSEPFYPSSQKFEYIDTKWKPLTELKSNNDDVFSFEKPIKNILYIAGRDEKNLPLEVLLNSTNIPILADISSNLYSLNNISYFESILRHQPTFLPEPDLIISSGRGLVSKILKSYIKSLSNTPHIYIAEQGEKAEPTESANQIYHGSRLQFFEKLALIKNEDNHYFKTWKNLSSKSRKEIETLVEKWPLSELGIMSYIFSKIPNNFGVHLSNSMPVRWGQIFSHHENIKYTNRGTSGIDGSTSSAIGVALVQEEKQILITGDVSFFYDINALWQQEIPKNLKIVVLNNHGGGIFRLIDGPSQQTEINDFFVMSRRRKIKETADSFSIKYLYANDLKGIQENFKLMEESDEAIILEIETDEIINGQVFELYKKI
ncbi:MAG: 2-succinyl-5-enolpyruvyl-6-hydroxy-3-cyclohexene-1-carboxylic-acid synthase [Bacteroidetes bacterium]|nr:2-succinyl-5-enolpyruvyl-6-hydroxy-3-cyclohexene-1-carboxylic-acid synthase [Bacteroidota bacterium]